jgi:hypothetical protein
MAISKQKKLETSFYKYPYLNLELLDMEGEIWKGIPGFEEYYMISNIGRVKTIARIVERRRQGCVKIKERILKQGLRTFARKTHEGMNSCLYFALCVNKEIYQMAAARAVYSAFVCPLKDFKEEELFILHKDLDPLNNRVENLYPATRKETGKRNVKFGMLAPPDITLFSDELWRRIKEIRSKPVSQFAKDGVYIASFESVAEASRQTGIHLSRISEVARRGNQKGGGYIWRYGTDHANLSKEALERYNPVHYRARRINQYDLDGNYLSSYSSITEVARIFGIERRPFNGDLLKGVAECNGFIWKYASPR